MDDEEDREGVASQRPRTETGSNGSTWETPPTTQFQLDKEPRSEAKLGWGFQEPRLPPSPDFAHSTSTFVARGACQTLG